MLMMALLPPGGLLGGYAGDPDGVNGSWEKACTYVSTPIRVRVAVAAGEYPRHLPQRLFLACPRPASMACALPGRWTRILRPHDRFVSRQFKFWSTTSTSRNGCETAAPSPCVGPQRASAFARDLGLPTWGAVAPTTHGKVGKGTLIGLGSGFEGARGVTRPFLAAARCLPPVVRPRNLVGCPP